MANETKTEAPVQTAKSKGLLTPQIVTVLGTVVAISERMKGGKFKYDTKIVTIEEVSTGKTMDVFITFNQWREYNCKPTIFVGNVVTFSLEDCIEDITGYYESPESKEMTAHEGTYKSFNRSVETSTTSVLKELSKSGVDTSTCKLIIEELGNTRRYTKSMSL